MKLLFICGRCQSRSPTAEAVFGAINGFEATSAGLSADTDEPLTEEHIAQADMIFVMEQIHRSKMNRKFAAILKGKKIVVLNIPDNYDFMADDLIALLWQRIPKSIPALYAHKPRGRNQFDGL